MSKIPVDFVGLRMEGAQTVHPDSLLSAAESFLLRTGQAAEVAYVGKRVSDLESKLGCLVIVSNELQPEQIWVGRVDRVWGEGRYGWARHAEVD